MSFFGVNVNPFSTPVGQKIEQATDGSLPSENWTLNMEICDIINETEDGPRDAIKAIKRRLNQAAGKNYTIVMYTLTVLETCVKNCGKRFHALACSREFVQELVKLIGPKNEPPTAVQEKVLSLIQTWADTFRHQPHTQGVVQVYQELKVKGIQFPMTDLDAMAPIITPERSVPEMEQNVVNVPASEQRSVSPNNSMPSPSPPPPPPQVQEHQSSAQVAQLNEQQLAKLQSELDVVQQNMRVLSEMLAYFTSSDQNSSIPQEPDDADLELLTELHSTCKAMQKRVVDLIGKLAHDEMTAELLRINDELNNLFLRYSRYTKNMAVAASTILAQTIGHPPAMDSSTAIAAITTGTGTTSTTTPPTTIGTTGNTTTTTTKQEAGGDSLIDLSDETDALEKKITGMGITDNSEKDRIDRREKKQGDNDEFDMFAQSRNTSYETTKNSGSKYEDNLEQVSGGSLSTAILNRSNPKNPQQTASTVASTTATSPGAHGDQESLTSSEFERFLAERAAAAEALPTLPAVPPGTTNTGSTTDSTNSATIQRQINKDQDKSLFAL
ncbi:TOM1-like protein 2 isoform X2 [Ceratina calcarata]|uniref:TOM1-like protein 2 isoform X2 n=1 Tax=Ceratina calcarata TaxID=156304 RepID=A0AAJ7JGZ7_9HYME|nr:TOM1-like protein 2 isoform X2 [Ceratina calcarata]